ncbi:IS66 family transposase [Nocardiopsis sp. CNT312]|uniref:IS66 family transposase n=1 Tax=Nocardiopsis sp. CNT312 TaxID=1137268 RepID=UPI0004AD1B97|nr:IS66 family transposase [Nocardiopsis sp. CNT312]
MAPSPSSSNALLERVLARVEELEARVTELETENAAKDARIAELEADNAQLRKDNTRLREENAQIKAENAQLRRSLGLDSTNSSQPPSTDKPWKKKPAPRSLRERSGNKPGKQPGDPGTTLCQRADPDRVIDHYPPVCGGCEAPLRAARPAGVRACQVFDLPEPAGLEVTEHRYHRLRCSCGHTTAAPTVPGAAAPACYGPRIAAVGAYLTSAHHLPVERTAEIMGDLLAARVSTGWLAGLARRAHTLLEGFDAAVRQAITASPVVHADETGARAAGAGHWVHVAGTGALTCYDLHPKRGREAMDAFGILPSLDGVPVTDALGSYTAYGEAHQLCCAHLLRELNALIEFEPDHAAWAKNMKDVLLGARDLVAQARSAGRTALSGEEWAGIGHRYGRVIAFAKAGPHHALIRRLDERRADYLRFAANFAVPFTNNAAERDLRMVKLQVKVSGGWRTLDGARYFCRLRSFISTARKQHHAAMDKLAELFAGNVWIPSTT